MTPFETGFALVGVLVLAALVWWMRTQGDRGDEDAVEVVAPTRRDVIDNRIEALRDEPRDGEPDISGNSWMGATANVWRFEPRPPTQPGRPDGWAPILDTTFDGRLSDHELLYLEALLRDQGVATVFVPWRPLEQFGTQGPQYPIALYVDAAKRDEAVAIWEDLIGDEPGFTFQTRLADPLLNAPMIRMELLGYQATFKELYRMDATTRRLVLGLLFAVVLAATSPVLWSGSDGGRLTGFAPWLAGSLGLIVPPLTLVVIPFFWSRIRAAASEELEPADPADTGYEEPGTEEDEEGR